LTRTLYDAIHSFYHSPLTARSISISNIVVNTVL
jgi:hypothetical protein